MSALAFSATTVAAPPRMETGNFAAHSPQIGPATHEQLDLMQSRRFPSLTNARIGRAMRARFTMHASHYGPQAFTPPAVPQHNAAPIAVESLGPSVALRAAYSPRNAPGMEALRTGSLRADIARYNADRPRPIEPRRTALSSRENAANATASPAPGARGGMDMWQTPSRWNNIYQN
ncbi:MAG: hypothetical protein ACRYGG_22835 [Janthinobacterium lividum]